MSYWPTAQQAPTTASGPPLSMLALDPMYYPQSCYENQNISLTEHGHTAREDHFQPDGASTCAGTTYGTAGMIYPEQDTTLATNHATALPAHSHHPTIAQNQSESGHDPAQYVATVPQTALYEVSTRQHSVGDGAGSHGFRVLANCHVPRSRSQLHSPRAIRGPGPVHHGDRRATTPTPESAPAPAPAPATTTAAELRASNRARGPEAVRGCVVPTGARRSAGPVRTARRTHACKIEGQEGAAPHQVSDGPPTVPGRHRGGQSGREPTTPPLVGAVFARGGAIAVPGVDADAADARSADLDVHHVPRDRASGVPRRPRGKRGRFGRSRG